MTSVKGQWHRKSDNSRIEDNLREELINKKTTPERKAELNAIFDLKQSFQIKIADINTPEDVRRICRDIIKGNLPCSQIPEIGLGPFTLMYFPWSPHYEKAKE